VPTSRSLDRKFAAITAGVVAIILYGSLYPFRFYIPPGTTNPLVSLLATWRIPVSRGDNLSNFLLYVPFGLFAFRAWRRWPPAARILAITAAGCVLSVAVEIAQRYDLTRDQGMADVYANTAGTLAGAIASAVFRRPLRLPLVGRVEWHPFVFLLLACWIGFELLPAPPRVWQTYRQFAEWSVAGLLLESIVGIARARWILALFVLGVAILGSAGIGALFGALLWIAVLSRLRIRTALVAALFIGYVVIQALAPFGFSATTHAFGWIPFRGFMQAPRGTAVRTFLEKTFTYGTLLWILVRAGSSVTVAIISSAALVFFLRVAQIYLPDRSAEITDCIMVLILAVVMRLLHPKMSRLQT
jgi:VanZ family protein